MSTSRVPDLAAGLQAVVRLYPWSVLWVLFAVAMALIVSGSLLALGVTLLLILAVVAHSAYRDRTQRKETDHD